MVYLTPCSQTKSTHTPCPLPRSFSQPMSTFLFHSLFPIRRSQCGGLSSFFVNQVSKVVNAPAEQVMDLILDSDRVHEYNRYSQGRTDVQVQPTPWHNYRSYHVTIGHSPPHKHTPTKHQETRPIFPTVAKPHPSLSLCLASTWGPTPRLSATARSRP